MFDTYLTPQKTETYYVTKEVHEHRAPTDESVKLLREMEQKAKDQVIKSIQLEANHLNANVYIYADPMSFNNMFRVVFDINGHSYVSDIAIPLDAPTDVIAQKLHRGISDVIAQKILEDVAVTVSKLMRGY